MADGISAKVTFDWAGMGAGIGGTGLALAGFSVAPEMKRYRDERDYMVPSDGRNPLVTLGMSAVGTMGVGMMARALKGEQVFTAKDVALDGAVGLQLGAGLIGDPRAEAFYLSGLYSLPLQLINRYFGDDKWDFRVGMLTQGLLGLGRAELGGNYIPFRGYEQSATGSTRLDSGELLGNAAADIVQDAAFYSLGNTLAALAQGMTDGERLQRLALLGGAYGGGEGLLTNLVMGAPVRLNEGVLAEGVRLMAASGGPDVSDVAKYTTFRTGGLYPGAAGAAGITLMQNVALKSSDLGEADLVGHELIHRDQAAGGASAKGQGEARRGDGAMGFYAQYLAWATSYDYRNIPYEVEAYHYAQGKSVGGSPDYPQHKYGALLGHGVNSLLFGLTSGYAGPQRESAPSAQPTGADPALALDEPTP